MTDASNNKIVWVLGAGFSRALGGPLLPELFDEHRMRRTIVTSPAKFGPLQKHWDNIIQVFHRRNGEPGFEHVFPWRDAEEFIELLELAALDDRQAMAVMGPLLVMNEQMTPKEMAKIARKLLAAVTHDFIAGTNTASERWHPYKRWAGELREQDEIISFNYDMVVENAHRAAVSKDIVRTMVGAPGRMHKPHGSVDWAMPNGNQRYPYESDSTHLISSDESEPAICVPGPSKMDQSSTMLKAVWDAATTALRSADVVVFMGYRFPPTDSYAKHELLTAIRESQCPVLTMRMVLGPQRSDDVHRLEGLLRWALSGREEHQLKDVGSLLQKQKDGSLRAKSFRIVHEPLWAEDFMTVFDRSRMVW